MNTAPLVGHHLGNAFWEKHGPAEALLADFATALTKRIRYFWPGLLDGQVTFSVTVAGQVVGLAGCVLNEFPGVLGLSYVSIDPEHRSRGYARLLAEAMAKFAVDNEYHLVSCSGYSLLGLERLRPVLKLAFRKVKICFRDSAKLAYPD